jgi:hypothetical protein
MRLADGTTLGLSYGRLVNNGRVPTRSESIIKDGGSGSLGGESRARARAKTRERKI